MLQQFGDEIWIAGGPTLLVAGFGYPTRMAVIRLSDGALFIWSPVALSTELRAVVDQLGPVRYIVAPNTLHYRFIGDWRAAYPTAKCYGLPDLRRRRPDMVLDCDLADTPAPNWSGDIDQVVVRGNWITTEVVFFHRRSGTVIFTDLLQHFDCGSFTGWRALVARLDFLIGPEPTVPRKLRVAFVDRAIARKRVRRILDWPAEKILMAHSTPVEEDSRAILARAFDWLIR